MHLTSETSFATQLAGAIDYTSKTWLRLRGGYQAMTFNYQAQQCRFRCPLRGPIMGATIRF